VPLRETLQTILTNYPKAKAEPLQGHALARFIRGDAEEAIVDALGAGLLVEAVPAKANGRLCLGSQCLIQPSR
jgi:5-methylcytosine-specific restriction enzyme A